MKDYYEEPDYSGPEYNNWEEVKEELELVDWLEEEEFIRMVNGG